MSVLSLIILVACGPETADISTPEYPADKTYGLVSISERSFSAVGLKKYDTRLVIAGDYNRDDLEAVLRIEGANAKRDHDHVFVYVYSDIAHYGKSGAYWVAMREWQRPGSRLAGADTTTITRCCEIYRCQVPYLWASRGDVRKECFTDIMGSPVP